jgi:hypothetical protein
MLEINGIPPKLSGQECEELICQQYWYLGKLENEVDILFLKVNGKWHQLYFENSVIFWRMQNEAPATFEARPEDPFKYPHVDLGVASGLRGRFIEDYACEQLVDGARVIIEFEGGDKLVITNCDNKTTLHHLPQ